METSEDGILEERWLNEHQKEPESTLNIIPENRRYGSYQTVEPDNPYSMTTEELISKRYRINRGRLAPQLFASFVAFLSAFSFGTIIGWSSPVAETIVATVGHSNVDLSWIPALVPLGAAVGVIPWCYAMDSFGPKKSLIIQSPFYITTWILLAVPTETMPLNLAMRFFSGLFGVCHKISGEALLVETVHRSLSFKVAIFFHSSIFLGVMFTQVAGLFMNLNYLSLSCCLFPVLHVVLLQFMPESPVYLYKKSVVLAERSLAWYRGPANIYSEMHIIQRDCDMNRLDVDMHRHMFYTKVVMKAFLVIAGVTLIRTCTGYFIFLMYNSAHLFISNHTHHTKTIQIMIALSFYLFDIFWLITHGRYDLPVRNSLILSSVGSGVCLLCASISLIFLRDPDSNLIWLPAVFISLLIFCVSGGLVYIPRVLALQYIPFQVYQLAARYLHVIHWLSVFVLLRVYELSKSTISNYVFLGILSLICFGGALFCYLCVIESKNKSLFQVQLEFGGNPIGNRSAVRRRLQIADTVEAAAVASKSSMRLYKGQNFSSTM